MQSQHAFLMLAGLMLATLVAVIVLPEPWEAAAAVLLIAVIPPFLAGLVAMLRDERPEEWAPRRP